MTRTQGRAALADALVEVYSLDSITDDIVDAYLASGWTAEIVAEITALAAFASDHALPISLDYNGKVIYRQGVFRRLVDFADRLTRSLGMPIAETVPWLAVVAGTPIERAVRVRPDALPSATLPLKRDLERRGDGSWVTNPADSVLAAWRSTPLPPGVAALGWMAGLAPEDATTAGRAGAIDVNGLRVLAGLRGYLLAPRLASEPGRS